MRPITFVFLLTISLGYSLFWTIQAQATPEAPVATFIVNSTEDAVDANPGDGVCATSTGVCTLRAAIQEANALPGADTITLPAGTYLLTITGADEDDAATGDLDIKDELTINGANAATTIIDGNNIDRVFHIFANTTLSRVTIQNGQVFDASIFACGGGGIRAGHNVTIIDSVIRNNQATVNNRGGGICMFAFGGNLTIMNSLIDNNVAISSGGGIDIGLPGNISLINSTVSNNRGWYGGGVNVGAGQGSAILSIEVSQILSNTATGGGGGVNFVANNGFVEIVATSFRGNQVPSFGQNTGGGLRLSGNSNTVNILFSDFQNNASNAYHGGALANAANNTTFNIHDSLFENNRALSAGGGIYSWAESVTINSRDSTFKNNSAGGWGGFMYTGNLTHTVNITNGRFTGNVLTNPNGWGGGINMSSAPGELRVVDGAFSQNYASTLGGAIYLHPTTSVTDTYGITAEINGVSFVQNVSDAGGGALYQGRSTMVAISNSAFVSNESVNGGAYFSQSDGLTGLAHGEITNSTFSNNYAFFGGGAMVGIGAGTEISLRNVTIAYNVADTMSGGGYGGGFYLNADASMLISNSLIAKNTDGSNEAPDCFNPATQVSGGWNLIGQDTGCNWSASAGDLVGTASSPIDPRLESLTGLLLHHPLGADSPAIDAGHPGPVGGTMPGCSPVDQIGVARPVDGNGDGTAVCDIGAIEYAPGTTEKLIFLPLVVR